MTLLTRVIYASAARSTHHKIALDALDHLQCRNVGRWRDLLLKYHEYYLDGAKAPDTKFKDFRNHVLHVRDNYWGGAPPTAVKWYEKTMASLARRDWPQVAFSLGVLSHYYTDPLMPFHTGQTKEENNIHRAGEWSVTKSYEELREQIERENGWPTVEVPNSEDWLEEMVIAGAELANRHYEGLIESYDFATGKRNPTEGYNSAGRAILCEVLGHAVIGWARIMEEIFAEGAIRPPAVNLTLPMVLASVKSPVKYIVNKLADEQDRIAVRNMYEEYESTGRVEQTLPEDDRVVRAAHKTEVLENGPPPNPYLEKKQNRRLRPSQQRSSIINKPTGNTANVRLGELTRRDGAAKFGAVATRSARNHVMNSTSDQTHHEEANTAPQRSTEKQRLWEESLTKAPRAWEQTESRSREAANTSDASRNSDASRTFDNSASTAREISRRAADETTRRTRRERTRSDVNTTWDEFDTPLDQAPASREPRSRASRNTEQDSSDSTLRWRSRRSSRARQRERERQAENDAQRESTTETGNRRRYSSRRRNRDLYAQAESQAKPTLHHEEHSPSERDKSESPTAAPISTFGLISHDTNKGSSVTSRRSDDRDEQNRRPDNDLNRSDNGERNNDQHEQQQPAQFSRQRSGSRSWDNDDAAQNRNLHTRISRNQDSQNDRSDDREGSTSRSWSSRRSSLSHKVRDAGNDRDVQAERSSEKLSRSTRSGSSFASEDRDANQHESRQSSYRSWRDRDRDSDRDRENTPRSSERSGSGEHENREHRNHWSSRNSKGRDDRAGASRPFSSSSRERNSSNDSSTSNSTDRYYLESSSPVADGPSIGPKTAKRLAKLDVKTVADLLALDAEDAAPRLGTSWIKPQTIRDWQDQAKLVCTIPNLRGHDAQILVACGYRRAHDVATAGVSTILGEAVPFCDTSEGKRIIRSGKKPDHQEVTDWVTWAGKARSMKAA